MKSTANARRGRHVAGGRLPLADERDGGVREPGAEHRVGERPAERHPERPVRYFTGPAAIPFWDTSSGTPDASRNRVEFFANLSTSGFGGNFCFDIKRLDGKIPDTVTDCAFAKSPAAGTTPSRRAARPAQGAGDGQRARPQRGLRPVLVRPPTTPGDPLTGEWDVPMRITWSFNYNDNGPKVVSTRPTSARSRGRTPTVTAWPTPPMRARREGHAGATGVYPAPEADPDKDGVYAAADLCPSADDRAPNGCPGGTVPAAAATGRRPPAPCRRRRSPPRAVGRVLAAQARHRAAAGGAREGAVELPVTCSRDAPAAVVDLTVTRSVAKRPEAEADGREGAPRRAAAPARGSGGRGEPELKLVTATSRAVGRSKRAGRPRPTCVSGAAGAVHRPTTDVRQARVRRRPCVTHPSSFR